MPGQFWAIPLKDGTFACGRVIELPPRGVYGGTVQFLAGLSSWHGNELPTESNLARHTTVLQAIVHIKAIVEFGGSILGYRSLEVDDIQPWLFRSQVATVGTVQRGYKIVRKTTTEDKELPVISWFGYDMMFLKAHKHFGINFSAA